jgi:hypothetical protein
MPYAGDVKYCSVFRNEVLVDVSFGSSASRPVAAVAVPLTGKPCVELKRPGSSPVQEREMTGRVECTGAGALVKSLATRYGAAGATTHVVYWAPPPPAGSRVLYVGMSRSLARRCSAHPKRRRDVLQTLNLPALDKNEARSVEEALLSHFGPNGEMPNDPAGTPAQLENRRHEFNPSSLDYCSHLVLGQTILRSYNYSAYATARYTRGIPCPDPR